MADKKPKNQIESFLTSDLVVENQVNPIPEGFTIIKKYPLHPPFSYVNILYNEEKSMYIYHVDELKLNKEEIETYKKLYRFLEESLESVDESKVNSTFDEQLKEVIQSNEKIFLNSSSVSLEKVKYYLKRDIDGFGIIDALMHDVNIEDVSCSGPNTPIYIWHRNYDSIPTNIEYPSHDTLNSFISRIVFRPGKHISTAFPITDLALKGNHRISVLYQKEVTPKGTSFTIRKFKEDPYTVVDLIKFGTISASIAAYLWMLVESKV